MPVDVLGQRLAERHQEDGPVDGVEAHDVLADDVDVRGPVSLIIRAALALAVIAETGDIVGERVQPDIDDVFGVRLDGDAPAESGAGHAKILQTGLQEVVDHLVAAGDGQDEIGMLLVILHQPVRIFAHAEEISLLFRLGDLSAAVGTLAVHELALRPEGLAGRAVEPLIGAFVDVPLREQTIEDLLHFLLVIVVRGADELVVRGVHEVPYPPDLRRHVVHELFGSDARRRGFELHLLAVLVRARLQTDVIALRAPEPREKIRQHDLVGVADVGFARCVCDRRSDVILFCHISSVRTLFAVGL